MFKMPRVSPIAPLLIGLSLLGAPSLSAEPSAPAPVAPAHPAEGPDAQAAYIEALTLLRAGEVAAASEALETLLRDQPLSPFADRAFLLLGRIASLRYEDPERLRALAAAELDGRPEDDAPAPYVAPTGAGEFIATQTLIFTALGFDTPYLTGRNQSAEVHALSALGGAALGLGASILYTKKVDVTLPLVQSIYWSQLTAVYNLQLMSALFCGRPRLITPSEPTDVQSPLPDLITCESYTPRTRAVQDYVGLAIGTPGGMLLHRAAPRTSGQLSMAFSSAVWGGYAGAMIGLSLVDWIAPAEPYVPPTNEPDPQDPQPVPGDPTDEPVVDDEETRRAKVERYALTLTPTLMADGALALAYVLGKDLNISRSRMRLVNLGGGLGTLVVGAGWVIAQPDEQLGPAFYLSLLGGTGAGLVVGALVTRGWDEIHHPEIFDDAGAGAALTFREGRLRIGQPVPTPYLAEFRREGRDPVIATGLSLQVLKGEW